MASFRRQHIDLAILLVAAVAGIVVAYSASAADGVRTIFVPKGVIYPGDEISADNLVGRNIARSGDGSPIFSENPNNLIGKVARRTLMPGDAISPSFVREKAVVTQGRTYKLLYVSPTVSIVGTGVPLQSAAVGEIVNVRNPDTGIIIKAVVRADQTLVIEEQ